VNTLRALIGVVLLIGVAAALSQKRSRIDFRLVFAGVFLQFLIAFFVLRTPVGVTVLDGITNFFVKLLSFGEEGARFMFGPLVGFFYEEPPNENVPSQVYMFASYPAHVEEEGGIISIIFAFKALTLIIYFSALVSILYHIGFMQLLIGGTARLLRGTMKVSGIESLVVAANVFIGQTEAPLVVRPYIQRMTDSEIMALMTGGFATIAGSTLGVYIGLLGPEYAGHLLAASFMSAPAAFVFAKVLIPETATPADMILDLRNTGKEHGNVLEAAASGATTGMKLYLNVMAMLIAFVALIALIDWMLTVVPTGGDPLTLSTLLGWLFSPIALAIGIPWQDAVAFGSFLGAKVAINEFVAYMQLAAVEPGVMSERSTIMAAYALCGFANFGSIGIQIGGLSALEPGRSADFARLSIRAMFGGFLASAMTACVAGAFIAA